MSAIDPTAISPAPDASHGPAHGDDHDHPPHLAHHFDTPEQQFDASKLGMWTFLATEILMFGGLFCAYAVYRFNNPGVFRYGEHHVSTFWGALNTIILLTSSLTMAMGVRAAQLGRNKTLAAMLIATILGGAGFMVIKAIEYNDKWNHGLFPGLFNRYDRIQNEQQFAAAMSGEHDEAGATGEAEHESSPEASHDQGQAAQHPEPDKAEATPDDAGTHSATTQAAAGAAQPPPPELSYLGPGYRDPNYGTPDAAKVRPSFEAEAGLHERGTLDPHAGVPYDTLSLREQSHVPRFFNIYFMMTGLHGLHVLVGIALITWILYRGVSDNFRSIVLASAVLGLAAYLVFISGLTGGHVILWTLTGLIGLIGLAWLGAAIIQSRRVPVAAGEFGPEFFTPVDLVGLYWHLVDLIWIFLFPLLYLIH